MTGPPEARVGAILMPQVVELTGASSGNRIIIVHGENVTFPVTDLQPLSLSLSVEMECDRIHESSC